MIRTACLSAFLLACAMGVGAQQVIPLYTDSIPDNLGPVPKEEQPTITAYIPPVDRNTGTAVVIFPGGAYSFLATKEEGTVIAEAFVKKGIAAFVVKYRLPKDSVMRDKSMAPLMDAQQAIRLVRLRSKEWHIDPYRVGVVGYSAGGHLAATLGTHFNKSYIPNKEEISLRPAFMILVYPVISMENGLTHGGSRISLLGEKPTPEQLHFFSAETNTNWQTPPTYITHASDDQVVTSENSVAFYQALKKKGVPVELHLYPEGNHGFTQRQAVDEWLEPMLQFLKRNAWYYEIAANAK
ncbi:alpha/beta hydrolase [Paraflavitalea soli]|uniref:Alpha/beta hydrolase n=1 Tax=Paraflavitalea soli TaxID=2315862 RepID=A0A3B7MN12_9BACT|nr:alpha/beta hydrolase [Paraflavitalea soli]AXY74749.1 alpha/beta hydrolase [Paraflavitalea soli]